MRRDRSEAILASRQIFTPGALPMIERFERNRVLTSAGADEFVREAPETFRRHSETTVDANTYQRLNKAHRLIADVVC
jgi:uncharacterized glyoxalase superfamily metalloenzyme YdcJ